MSLNSSLETELDATTTERYELLAKILSVPYPHRERQSRGREFNDTPNVSCLKYEMNDQGTMCSKVWLPDETEFKLTEFGEKIPGYTEVGMKIGYPVHGFVRGALFRASHLCPFPHIYIMSKRAEDILQKHVGETIRVTVLGEQEFDEAYEAKAETRSPYDNMP